MSACGAGLSWEGCQRLAAAVLVAACEDAEITDDDLSCEYDLWVIILGLRDWPPTADQRALVILASRQGWRQDVW